jgi:preprotein translocase subunit SecA
MLSVLDSQWKDHLLNMDHLKEGIGLRGYGQHDPLVEYKRESFDMFEAMMLRFQEETVRYLYLMQVIENEAQGGGGRVRTGSDGEEGGPIAFAGGPPLDLDGGDGAGVRVPRAGGGSPPRRASTSVDEMEEAFLRRKQRELQQARMAGSGDLQQVQQVVRSGQKVGRNDPCPCGSGKKYKKCCGANS